MIGLLGGAILGGTVDVIEKNQREKEELAKDRAKLFDKQYEEYRADFKEAKKRKAELERSTDFFKSIAGGDTKMARTLALYAKDSGMSPADVATAYANGQLAGVKVKGKEIDDGSKVSGSSALFSQTNAALSQGSTPSAAPVKEEGGFMSGMRDFLGYSGKDKFAEDYVKSRYGEQAYNDVMSGAGLEEDMVDTGYSIKSTEGQFFTRPQITEMAMKGGLSEASAKELAAMADNDESGRGLVPASEVIKRAQNKDFVLAEMNNKAALEQAKIESQNKNQLKPNEVIAGRKEAYENVMNRLSLSDKAKEVFQRVMFTSGGTGETKLMDLVKQQIITPEEAKNITRAVNLAEDAFRSGGTSYGKLVTQIGGTYDIIAAQVAYEKALAEAGDLSKQPEKVQKDLLTQRNSVRQQYADFLNKNLGTNFTAENVPDIEG